eukprot:SM000094S24723  [mRNA]  locus=s94:428404:430352:+ [translate_table: standard]
MFRRIAQKAVAATRQALAWDAAALQPPAQSDLFRFCDAADLARWAPYSDAEHGEGDTSIVYSNSVAAVAASLTARPLLAMAALLHAGLSVATWTSAANERAAIFTGSLSEELAGVDGKPQSRLKRSGFAGLRTAEFAEPLDLEAIDTLALRVRGDGRCYVHSLRTESWVGMVDEEENTWQAFIFAPPGEWYEVKIPLERYLLTWKGKVLDTADEINTRRLCGMGISVAAGQAGSGGPGPFRLELEWIKGLRTT